MPALYRNWHIRRLFAALRRPQVSVGGLAFHLRTLARIDNFLRIDGVLIRLLLNDLPIFANQEVHATRSLVFVFVDSILTGYFAAPVTQQGEGYSDLVGKCFIGEGTIHAHTQDLGVGSFQRLQILLEVFHLLRSTTGEGENIKSQDDVLLAPVVAQLDVFQIVAVEVFQREIRSHVADFRHARSLLFGLRKSWPARGRDVGEKQGRRQQAGMFPLHVWTPPTGVWTTAYSASAFAVKSICHSVPCRAPFTLLIPGAKQYISLGVDQKTPRNLDS